MLNMFLAPLSLVATTFNAGDTVRVTISFNYVVGVNTTVKLQAVPYYTNILGKHMVNSCVGSTDLPLVAASTPTPQSTTVDLVLVPKANGGIDNGTYGLRVWIEGTDALAEQDSVIIVSGNSSGGIGDTLTSIMPMLMMVMMMGMIMPMMQGMGGGSEE